MSYQRLYALVRDKEIDLVVSLDERGKRYVFIDDLIRYLYPSYVFSESTTPESGVSDETSLQKKLPAGREKQAGEGSNEKTRFFRLLRGNRRMRKNVPVPDACAITSVLWT
uniref:Uncharacterized protein n=1 Tax=Leptospirillum ferriphilum TaxID=178606 RepID=A0A2I2MFI0_9BACT